MRRFRKLAVLREQLCVSKSPLRVVRQDSATLGGGDLEGLVFVMTVSFFPFTGTNNISRAYLNKRNFTRP